MNLIRSIFDSKVNSLSICLDRANGTFFPGELVTGRLLVFLNHEINSHDINLVFKGKVHTMVQRQVPHSNTVTVINTNGQTTVHNRSSSVRTETYFENLELFQQTYQFSAEHPQRILPGQHEFPFRFQIPINLPSSFQQGNSASIYYRLKAKVASKNTDYTINLLGSVTNTPQLYNPVFDTKSKKVGIINGKQLNMRCDLPRIGWTVGSDVIINCMIDNHSSKNMELSASLKQDVRITARGHTDNHTNKILNTTSQRVTQNIVGGKYQITFRIPDRLPIVHNTCRTIQIDYYVEVKLYIPMGIDLHCKLPIVLSYQMMGDNVNRNDFNIPPYPFHPVMPPYQTNPMPPPSLYPSLNDPYLSDASSIPSAPSLDQTFEPPPPYQPYDKETMTSLYPNLPEKN